ncbi:TPA: hypothetical protein DDZ86_03295 [Candidatus Dependentiae bacterium]|nr:MAG: hypothetical protein UW09_C0003G0012 [candidate division TM6 bacterium GW2011_GWF2_43_87]HBL98642.1 hypothetical protein [Candidatus Dependentiae bacterium]
MLTYSAAVRHISLITCILLYTTTLPYDVTLPYFARFFPGEPHLCKGRLTTIDLRVAGTTNAQHRVEKDSRLYDTSTHGFILSLYHNPLDSLFFEVTLPFYHIHHDCPAYGCCSLKELGMSAWTTGISLNLFSPEKLDFVDLSIETGILFPPSAHGRNGCGVPLKGSVAIGLFDWITIGAEGDVAYFFDSVKSLQYNVNWFLEADHFVRGFSCLLGYSYSHQKPAPYFWHPLCCDYWSMHTLHMSLGYDLATEHHPGLPNLELFYNRLLNGINVTGNSMVGLSIRTTF